MQPNTTYNRRNVLFLLFALFLVAIFVRWGILVNQKNVNAYQDKMALYDLIIDIDTSETTLELYQQEVVRLDEQYKRQRFRIRLEGVLFFLLLVAGIIRMFIYFRKEIDLALQQSNFLLSITHELKSPLASALLNIQTLLKRKSLAPDKQQKLLENSEIELTRLRSLIERLLLTARMEDDQLEYNKTDFNLSDLYQNLFEQYESHHGNNFKMTSAIEPAIPFFGDKTLVAAVFANLLDNAVKYTSANGKIDVHLKAKDDGILFSVANDAPFISSQDKKNIWKKFYRLGDDRTRSSKGTGLGLYIVQQIVEGHAGEVAIKDVPNGIRFDIVLPMTQTNK